MTISDEIDEIEAALPETGSRMTWRYDGALIGALIFAVVAVAIFFMALFNLLGEKESEVKAGYIESAFRDVRSQRVPVNGPRGSEEWRSYYAKGLERFLNSHDFNQSCTFNGFLRDVAAPNTTDCIAIGNARVLRAQDGTVRYFSERSLPAETVELDVLQRDVHADDYLDIDELTSAIQERAYVTKRVAPSISKVEDSKSHSVIPSSLAQQKLD